MREVTIVAGLTATVADAAAPSERPPILFVHGMFGGAWMFERWQPLFAELGWGSHAIDLRGHGASRPVRDIGRVSVRDHVADALAVARAMGRPIVVGHSMGGLIAQKLAEADAVSAAVLVCAAPPRGISVLSPSLASKMLHYLGPLLFSQPIEPSFRDAEDLMLNAMPPAERAAVYARLVRESGRAGREMALGTLPVDASRVRVPVLVLRAEDDRFVAPRVGRQLADRYGAPLRSYAGHGHYLIGEPGWERAAADVAAWLDGLTMPRPAAAPAR